MEDALVDAEFGSHRSAPLAMVPGAAFMMPRAAKPA